MALRRCHRLMNLCQKTPQKRSGQTRARMLWQESDNMMMRSTKDADPLPRAAGGCALTALHRTIRQTEEVICLAVVFFLPFLKDRTIFAVPGPAPLPACSTKHIGSHTSALKGPTHPRAGNVYGKRLVSAEILGAGCHNLPVV